MSKIVFLNDPNTIYDGQFSQIGTNQVRLVFTDVVPSEDILLSGFNLVNEHNGYIQTERPDYKYIYRTYKDEVKKIELCNDNNPWVEPPVVIPEYVCTFSAGIGGTLDGETSQKIKDYSELIVPTPIPDDNYEFVQWNPEIPTEGEVNNNQYFTAEFVYIPTLDEVKTSKIQEFNTICNSTIEAGQDIELSTGETIHFDYTQYNQTNLSNGVNVALTTKEAVPYYDSNNRCYLFSAMDMVNIYVSCQGYITYILTLDHQLEETIKKMTDKEAIKNLAFDITSLDEESLAAFNEIITQAQIVVNKYIANAQAILEA